MTSSLERLKESHNVTVKWHAFELRPKGSPPMPEWYRERIKAAQPHLKATAWEHYGLEINSGPSGIDSRPALIGAKYAEAQGKGEEYYHAVLEAYWQEARDISDISVLQSIVEKLGLNVDEYTAALSDSSYEVLVDEDILRAQTYGLSGVPALIFAGKYLVSGAQPYHVLVNIVEEIQAKGLALAE